MAVTWKEMKVELGEQADHIRFIEETLTAQLDINGDVSASLKLLIEQMARLNAIFGARDDGA